MINVIQSQDEKHRKMLAALRSMDECCDPCDLAYSLGLRVRPSREPRASVRDGILRFPNRANLDIRGLSIFLALAEHLLPAGTSPASILESATELALPRHVARFCSISGLREIQPHFPPRLLEAAAMRKRGSGVMARSAV